MSPGFSRRAAPTGRGNAGCDVPRVRPIRFRRGWPAIGLRASPRHRLLQPQGRVQHPVSHRRRDPAHHRRGRPSRWTAYRRHRGPPKLGTRSSASIRICISSCLTPASMSQPANGRPEAAPSWPRSRSSPACSGAASLRSSPAPMHAGKSNFMAASPISPIPESSTPPSWPPAARTGSSTPNDPFAMPNRSSAISPDTRTELPSATAAIIACDGQNVSFRCRKPTSPGQRKPRYGTATITADEFIRRFLLHVLPNGLHRIRHFGILANGSRAKTLEVAREALGVNGLQAHTAVTHDGEEDDHRNSGLETGIAPVPCPHCGGELRKIREISRRYDPFSSRDPPPAQPGAGRETMKHRIPSGSANVVIASANRSACAQLRTQGNRQRKVSLPSAISCRKKYKCWSEASSHASQR